MGNRQYEALGQCREPAARRGDRGRMAGLHDVDRATGRAGTHQDTPRSRLPESWRHRRQAGVLRWATRSVNKGHAMNRFDKVKQILDALVGGKAIGAHGAFWRELSIEQFRAKQVFGWPLVALGDGEGSNLVKSLRGLAPFGSDTGVKGATFRRMPVGRPPASDQQIRYIADWID